jgi:pimeloyl-ACP methyl ester carboxylesterase
MRDNAIERLFSLFTSSDRAVAIAGDLAEEREQRGQIWFWLHVVRITFALWRNAAVEAPLRVLALILAGPVLLAVPALGGVAAVFLFPGLVGSAVSWIALSVFWWGGALWTGASLVTIAPRRGMPACVILAVIVAALVVAFGATVDPRELSGPVGRMFFTTALGATVALLAGGAIARRGTTLVAVPLAVTIGLAAAVLFLTPAASSAAHQDEGRDSSPHVVKFVDVDTDVRLEVLDWGGSGPALVLLAGGGATAHQYDDLAPALAARYRVVGVTRRGHRGSSAAPGGYGVARLAEDVLRVIDALGLTNPVVIGHSFAGEEMHVLGARHSGRIRGLVYIDAAFDRGDDSDNEAYNAAARPVPAAPSAKTDDLASFAALRAYLDKYGGAGPEGYLRTRYRANPDGSVGGLWTPERPIIQAMRKEMRAGYNPYNPERIRVPALAIYAVPKSAEDLMRRGSSDRLPFPELVTRAADDPALRERVEKLYLLTRERVRDHVKWFQGFAEQGRVVELSGTHDLIVSNPSEVLEQIEAFVSSLPGRP